MLLLPGGRFADHSPVRTAVHADPQRAVEAHVPQVGAFVEGLAGVEQILAEDAVAAEGVDRQVSYAQRGDVLEEVRALRGLDVEPLDAALDDHLCLGDVGPLDRDAQERVRRPPAARAYQYIGALFVAHPGV